MPWRHLLSMHLTCDKPLREIEFSRTLGHIQSQCGRRKTMSANKKTMKHWLLIKCKRFRQRHKWSGNVEQCCHISFHNTITAFWCILSVIKTRTLVYTIAMQYRNVILRQHVAIRLYDNLTFLINKRMTTLMAIWHC